MSRLETAALYTVLALLIWIGWSFVEYVTQLQDRLAAAEEKAATVYIPRDRWLCHPIERRPGAWICREPRKT